MIHAVAIVVLPLISAVVAGFFGRFLGDRTISIVTSTLLVASAILAWIVSFQIAASEESFTIYLFTWIDSGAFEVDWALYFDRATAVMLVVVTTVSAVVHIYSIGYMEHDPHKPRFFSYLSLFTFAMLMLVTADNFLQMFFGWEGVGVCSYLLIGFWYKRPSANAAAIKAFLVNRVGDFGFALGVMGVFLTFNSVSFEIVFATVPDVAGTSVNFLSWQFDTITLLCLLLFVGAMGKSAQLPLHTWLPDAMEGPTPVSALIHAATMVTAGVFMVVRLSPMFEYSSVALAVVAIIGATTAIFAATVAVAQNDIKRVIAYSTCSQLGYMLFACGIGAYAAALFHLFTHAFFKALLFLGSGAVIHAVHGQQDMRYMGGLWRKLPITCAFMWIGGLALTGIPVFAGYWSKDLIIESAFVTNGFVGGYAFWVGIATAFLTALYSWRLIIMTFHGRPRMTRTTFEHAHEAPKTMWIPLLVLALGATIGGLPFLGGIMVHHGGSNFFGDAIVVLGDNVVDLAHRHTPLWVKAGIVGVVLAGIGVAFVAYIHYPGLPGLLVSQIRPLHRFLLEKWYFDWLFDGLLVRAVKRLGLGLWKIGDEEVINGLGPGSIAAVTHDIARHAKTLQSGYVYHYAFVMLIGLVVVASWLLFEIWS